ncbi:MAG: RIP metalloprotease RseP [Alphaproteobacteria bacterium]|nr:RIP metalloprotease RseP [Alphaproteobacteria bacterium]
MPPPIDSILAFLVVLGVLVFIHELGHYLAARMVGVHVETFSIGFGRAIASWTDRHGTVWKLAWLPLGGYVKLHGQERPEDVTSDVQALWQEGRTFHEKQVAARAFVVAAGPLANFLLAAVLFAGLYATLGKPVAPERTDPVAVIGEVVANSAAAKAGLKVGDRILSIEGKPIERFSELQATISAAPGQTLALRVLRGNSEISATATVEARGATGILGVRSAAPPPVFEPVGLGASLVGGVERTWDVSAQTLAGLWQMITAQRGTEELGGPLRIAQLSGQVAQLGVASLVSFIAVLSVNLALINLFPIPILDGGHLLFYLAEAIRGKPLPPRAQEYGMRAGLAVILALFVFATWNDLGHLGLFRWVAGLVG